MMKCTDIQKYLDDYLDDAMSLGEQKAVETHVEQCTACQQALQAQRAVHQALATLPVEEASPDFEARVFAEVRRQHGAHSSRHFGNRFTAGFATAMVASLALWFTSTVYLPQIDEQAPQHDPQVINLAMNQARTVKLLFDAPTDLANVTLTVELPENIELEGYAGQKQLVWQTNLNKGQNMLTLPVIAVGDGQGELVAQLNYGDKTQKFRIVLKTASNGALIYQLNTLKTA
jgi:anti-sigma-K factor RskA